MTDILKKILRLAIIFLLLMVIAFSGYKLYQIFSDYHEVTVANNEVREEYFSISDDGLPQVDFEGLLAMNKQIVGWIYIPDTNVNFPVLRADDNSRYLYADYALRYSFAGSIFMDYRCSADFSDQETMIYGHNMHNGDMFGRLKKFEDPDYLKAHEKVYILLPGDEYLEYKASVGEYISINDDVYELPKKDGDPETLVLSTCTDNSSDTIRFVLKCDYEGKNNSKKTDN